MNNYCLVSVTVLTYNSSATIVESLESIKAQTYQNIELIVSDDCSTDNTVELCRKWLADNKGRFVRTELLMVGTNTGVCANGNRAISACRGIWRKGVAADDKLLPNCIQDFVDYANEHPNASFITSFERDYRNTFEEKNLIKARKAGTADLRIFEKDAEYQLKVMAFLNFVNAPTIFFKCSLFNLVGGYDERYAYEDHPFYINVLEHGYKIYHMPKETVCYRVHDSTFNSNSRLFNPAFMRSTHIFLKERCFKYYTTRQKFLIRLRWLMEYIIDKVGLNRHSRIMDSLYKKIVNMPYKLHKISY